MSQTRSPENNIFCLAEIDNYLIHSSPVFNIDKLFMKANIRSLVP